MAASGIVRRAMRGINLDEIDSRSAIAQLTKPCDIRVNFLRRGFCPLDQREQTLDYDRSLFAERDNVFHHLRQRNIRAIDTIQIGLGAAVELRPNLIAQSQQPNPCAHVWHLQTRAVCDQHDFKKWKTTPCAQMRDGLDDLA